MITHSIDSYRMQSQNKPKSKLQMLKKMPKIQILECCKKKPPLHATHILKLLDKMCRYKIDPASIVEDT